ncbi:hypothetical protein ACHAQJ_009546, partial [Trichoderma viride]
MGWQLEGGIPWPKSNFSKANRAQVTAYATISETTASHRAWERLLTRQIDANGTIRSTGNALTLSIAG